jgi:pimeloyl-ACP methyl ester carboxylesterase
MRRMLATLAASMLAALSGTAAAAPGDEIYTRPGRIVAASDGARLNLYCMGKGGPPVIFESGFSDWAPAWATVQRRVARFTTACSYDRAGSGFSGPGPMPRTSARIAGELRSVLRSAGVRGPYILVGHAFGGDHVRAFADLYPADVAGLVLDEADASDVEPAALRDEDHRGNERFLAVLRSCRDAVAAGKAPAMLPHRQGRPDRACSDIFFRGLPDDVWSPALNAKLRALGGTKAIMFDALVSEMEEMPADEAWLQQHKRRLGATPVRILTSRNHGVGRLDGEPPTPEQVAYEQQVTEAQARWLDLSSDAKQIFPTNSSEYVQFDDPDTLIQVLREIHDKRRKR